MAEVSLNDRMIISQTDAKLSEIQHTIRQIDGLADALELEDGEGLKINANGRNYGIYLSRPVQQETLYVSILSVNRDRKAIAKALLVPNKHDHENKLRNIVAARMASGSIQEPWQYQCHPLLLRLLELSKIEPATFIANMKGHIGKFRTQVNQYGQNDGRRRNFSKLRFPLEYDAKGGEIILESIRITDQHILHFAKGQGRQDVRIMLPKVQIPATLAENYIGESPSQLLDNDALNYLLADEKIESIKSDASSMVVMRPRGYVPMADGADQITERFEKIARQLHAWAVKDPLPLQA